VLGPDLAVIQRIGLEIESALVSVPGTRASTPNASRRATSRTSTWIAPPSPGTGVSVEDVQDRHRNSARRAERDAARWRAGNAIRSTSVTRAISATTLPSHPGGARPTPDGEVPLSELARIEIHQGPAMIRDENGMLAGYVYVDTQARDLGGYVGAAQAAVRDRVTLPQGIVSTGPASTSSRCARVSASSSSCPSSFG
jgi:Cu(I)/Ag(I) efflux system membrane protein CusA/SilA